VGGSEGPQLPDSTRHYASSTLAVDGDDETGSRQDAFDGRGGVRPPMAGTGANINTVGIRDDELDDGD